MKNLSEIKKNKTFKWIYGLLLILIPIILLLLPGNYFDSGKSYCLSIILLHKTCMGCGITKAVQHSIHFEFETAWHYNKLVILILPILVFIYLKELIRILKKLFIT